MVPVARILDLKSYYQQKLTRVQLELQQMADRQRTRTTESVSLNQEEGHVSVTGQVDIQHVCNFIYIHVLFIVFG